MQELQRAYDGSTVLFRFLSELGWGELVNLGYFPLPMLPALVRGLNPFQRKLVDRSLALLDARPGHRVLDAACGRGYTTMRLARAGCDAVGVDLLEYQINEARARFDARFEVGDVTRLEVGPESFDRVHCLEAAFHFGPQGRRDFLAESFRVLRPGGRLVLVDLMWGDEHPERIAQHDPGRLVRDMWSFEDFEPLQRYRRNAREIGFREHAIVDWTRPVLDRAGRLTSLGTRIGLTRPGRRLITAFRPRLAEFSDTDWSVLAEFLRVHNSLRRSIRYVALVLDKPA